MTDSREFPVAMSGGRFSELRAIYTTAVARLPLR